MNGKTMKSQKKKHIQKWKPEKMYHHDRGLKLDVPDITNHQNKK